MASSKKYEVETTGAKLEGVLYDTHIRDAVASDFELMSAYGPRVTFNFITDRWDIDNDYSYYDVVQHCCYTYICIKDAPKGTDIEDKDYWLLWADPNAQFMELYNLVMGLEDIDKLKSDIDRLITSAEEKLSTFIDSAETEWQSIFDEYIASLNALKDEIQTAEDEFAKTLQDLITQTEDDIAAWKTMLDAFGTKIEIYEKQIETAVKQAETDIEEMVKNVTVSAVLFVEQSLSDDEKTQARENIGAVSANDYNSKISSLEKTDTTLENKISSAEEELQDQIDDLKQNLEQAVSGISDAVLYSEQVLSDDEQGQARKNISTLSEIEIKKLFDYLSIATQYDEENQEVTLSIAFNPPTDNIDDNENENRD